MKPAFGRTAKSITSRTLSSTRTSRVISQRNDLSSRLLSSGSTPNISEGETIDTFQGRHIGPNASETQTMLEAIGYQRMEDFVTDAVPQHIRIKEASLNDTVIPSLTESEMLKLARKYASKNKVMRSYIGMGYHNAVTPKVIQRNVSPRNTHLARTDVFFQIFENPAWYTQYTPYQPELAQG